MAGAVALVAGLIGAGVLAYDRLVSRPKTLHAALEAIPEPEAAAPKPIDDAAAPSSGSREVAPADSARARELGDEARRAIASKDYDQALDLLSKAWDAAPAASTAKHLALCYLAKGDNASAARWLRQYLKDAGSASDVSYVERFLATNP
jgi:thioredoxin-like negative regulator of GroEL